MRAWALFCALSALLHPSHTTPEPEPAAKEVAYLNTYEERSSNPLLVKRQSCPSGYGSCSDLGDSGACCPNDTNCARDSSGQIACCPIGASCVGSLGSGSASTSPYVLGGTTTTTQSSASSITSQATLASGYSTVPNQYYPFIQIPSTYANSQACLQAFTSCQSASTACFNSLNGQNGVTISGIGTQGTTQAGITGSVASGASSICSSLSEKGCYGLQSSQCSQFGSGGATVTTGFVGAAGNGAYPAAARCTGALYTAAAAAMAGAGIARMAIV